MHIGEALIDRVSCGMIVAGRLRFAGDGLPGGQDAHSHLLLRVDGLGARFQAISSFTIGPDGFCDVEAVGPSLNLRDVTHRAIDATVPILDSQLMPKTMPDACGEHEFAGPDTGTLRDGWTNIARVLAVALTGSIGEDGLDLAIDASLGWLEGDGDDGVHWPQSVSVKALLPWATLKLCGFRLPSRNKSLRSGGRPTTLVNRIDLDDRRLTSLCVPSIPGHAANCSGRMNARSAHGDSVIAERIVELSIGYSGTVFSDADGLWRQADGFCGGNAQTHFLRAAPLDPRLISNLLRKNGRGRQSLGGDGLGVFGFRSGLGLEVGDPLQRVEQVIRSLTVEVAITEQHLEFEVSGELDPIGPEEMNRFEDRISEIGGRLPESLVSFTARAAVPTMLLRLRGNSECIPLQFLPATI